MSSRSGRGKFKMAAIPVSWDSCSPLVWSEEKTSVWPPNSRTFSKSLTNFARWATLLPRKSSSVTRSVSIAARSAAADTCLKP